MSSKPVKTHIRAYPLNWELFLFPPVFMVLCFIAGTDAVIALEKDGYTSSFADFYIREVGLQGPSLCSWK